ncbi:PQQ-dependent sugar dehydrogenase [Sediminibacterium ginsengisoli]|uniref:Glucose/arabinose dehydrogenase, beta-propeller fold n=1 Tax=Sediminibacterium ginsengisoli TaxID=413434 RepID=A0A1T4PT70_9BACT|nr:PQQ-dependent sugar dehydrogenase [Sediminibacterium ginsengisoli]SJZ94486.1 Glucose/arabinose dehydrogenase, beta-propeller fold [Sediminibacterium ginsengisoli]
MPHSYLAIAAFMLSGLFSCSRTVEDNPGTSAEEPVVKTETLVNNYEIIWGMDFLPDGDLLFTEKKGKIHRYSKGTVTEITGVPAVNNGGQGGLLDLKVHPNYAQNGWIYCTYSGTDNTGKGSWNLARFKITANAVNSWQSLLTTTSPNGWQGHYGSRIVFGPDNLLYVSVGEGGPGTQGGANSFNKNAQSTTEIWGKVHRLTDDGLVPGDNPILPGNAAPNSIYSYGHRNPQGLAWNPFTNELWETEHGPKGGDEVNIIRKGANYGWPLVSYGINYDGTTISENPEMTGVDKPIHTWTPSIATCGLAFITSNKFKAWKGNMLVGSLVFKYLSRLEMSGNRVVKENKLLENIGRVRNVKQGPDGNIYVSVEGPGRIIRLVAE